MTPQNLQFFAELLHQRTGILIDETKDYLVKTRLAPIAGTSGYADIDALIDAIRERPEARMVDAALDAMTTNETFFFRDQTPFEALRTLLSDPGRRGSGPIRIWSAAASTGQEAYSIAMLCDELPHLSAENAVEIVGTDISQSCLTKAAAGVYSSFEIQRGLPIQKLTRYFEKDGESWRAKTELRSRVTWKRHNLMDSPWALGRFDIVFCRNVLIYFDVSTRRRILDLVAGQMQNGGHLFLGASETTLGVTNAFTQTSRAGCWIKADAGAAPHALSA